MLNKIALACWLMMEEIVSILKTRFSLPWALIINSSNILGRVELAKEGSVKSYLTKIPASQVPLKLRLKWS